jgi:hypothetical protein
MTTLPLNDIQIKEIAEKLDCGFNCYWNTSTNELIFIPEIDGFGDNEELWKDDLKKVKKDKKQIKIIEKPASRESFQIMENFVDNLIDANPDKKMLQFILQNKKPFANFNRFIHQSADLREHWFAHKNESFIELVREQIANLIEL